MRLILTGLLLSVTFCCYGQVAATSVDYATQTITHALTEEPPQLNSMKATDQVSVEILGHVMEGLVRYDRRGNITPGVAKRWEVNDTDATFWLRRDAKWSDGKGVTAHDFIFAWRNVHQNFLEPVMFSSNYFPHDQKYCKNAKTY